MKTIDQLPYIGLCAVDQNTGVQQLSKEETNLFLHLTMSEMSGSNPPPDMVEELMRQAAPSIITSRISHAGVPWEKVVNLPALLFLSTMDTMRSPGQCVMWAYTLLYMYAKYGRQVNIDLLSNVFPNGFPTLESYDEMWDKQKGHNMKIDKLDNYLDTSECWDDLVNIVRQHNL